VARISLARKVQPEASDFSKVAEELCSAFQETGFAYLVNHGIGPDLIKEAMEKSFEFFSLDEHLKEKLRKGPEYQGWVAQGREIFDQDEEGNIAELEVRETFDLKNISPGAKFPDESCPALRPALTALSGEQAACREDLGLRVPWASSRSRLLGQEASGHAKSGHAGGGGKRNDAPVDPLSSNTRLACSQVEPLQIILMLIQMGKYVWNESSY